MVYEARESARRYYVLAGLCVLLSLLGFVTNGIIPTASTSEANGGTYPITGWIIVAVCFGMAFEFVRRARFSGVRVRIDANGIYFPQYADQVMPWNQILSMMLVQVRYQRSINFELRNPDLFTGGNALIRAGSALNNATGFGHFGIVTTYYDHGMDELLAAVRHYRPDLIDGSDRL